MQSIWHLERPHAPLHASLIAGLDAPARERLLAGAVRRRFDDGQIIQQHGDEAGGCWVVESGRVKLGRHTAAGNFVLLTLLGPGESYGELSLLRRAARTVDAMALGTVELHWIDARHFEQVLASDPALLRTMAALLGDLLDHALGRMVAERSLSDAQRITGLLAELAGSGPNPVRLPLTQQDLAELVGTSRVTVGTVLAGLARAGLIERGYGWIDLRDIDRLRAMVAEV